MRSDATQVGGAKSIGFWSGVLLLINNITGPGVPVLPNLFVEAGWLIPMACTIGVWLITTLSAAMFAEAMRCIPGNEHFRGRVEYSTVVAYYFGRRWYAVAQFGLNGALQALNVISVIQSAQVTCPRYEPESLCHYNARLHCPLALQRSWTM